MHTNLWCNIQKFIIRDSLNEGLQIYVIQSVMMVTSILEMNNIKDWWGLWQNGNGKHCWQGAAGIQLQALEIGAQQLQMFYERPDIDF